MASPTIPVNDEDLVMPPCPLDFLLATQSYLQGTVVTITVLQMLFFETDGHFDVIWSSAIAIELIHLASLYAAAIGTAQYTKKLLKTFIAINTLVLVAKIVFVALGLTIGGIFGSFLTRRVLNSWKRVSFLAIYALVELVNTLAVSYLHYYIEEFPQKKDELIKTLTEDELKFKASVRQRAYDDLMRTGSKQWRMRHWNDPEMTDKRKEKVQKGKVKEKKKGSKEGAKQEKIDNEKVTVKQPSASKSVEHLKMA